MRYIRYKYIQVTVLPPSSTLPGLCGEGTALVLPTATLSEMDLPPALRHTFPREGILISGYNAHLRQLLVGEKELSWCGWPEIGIAVLATGIAYQRALDDPLLRALMHRLFGLSPVPEAHLNPLTLPALTVGTEQQMYRLDETSVPVAPASFLSLN